MFGQLAVSSFVSNLCWLLKHDNLGRERAAPHQPSTALNGGNCSLYCWDEPHITTTSFADLHDGKSKDLRVERAKRGIT